MEVEFFSHFEAKVEKWGFFRENNIDIDFLGTFLTQNFQKKIFSRFFSGIKKGLQTASLTLFPPLEGFKKALFESFEDSCSNREQGRAYSFPKVVGTII